jgi:hypothetical protein
MTALQETFAEAIATIGPTRTMVALRTELMIVQAKLAGFKDHERELLELIRQAEASI